MSTFTPVVSTEKADLQQEYSYSEAIMERIEGVVGGINDLFAQINGLMREIQAIRGSSPTHPGAGASAEQMATYNRQLNEFRRNLAELNKRMEQAQKRLAQAQAYLASLQLQELPEAERKDAEQLLIRTEQAQKSFAVEVKRASTNEEDAKVAQRADEARIDLRAATKEVEIFDEIGEDVPVDLKKVVRVMQLLMESTGRLEDRQGTDAPVAQGIPLQSVGIDPDNEQRSRQYFESLSARMQTQLQSVASAMTLSLINNEQTDAELQARWSDFVSEASSGMGAIDVDALVQWVLRESYQETTQDLYFFAQKVKFFNEVKKKIRDELTAARNHLAGFAGAAETANIGSYVSKDIVTDFTGGSAVSVVDDTTLTTKGELEAYIQSMEEKLSSVGDDAQLANVDLQNMLQKQQQTIQKMSNISKLLHDTALAIIRKIGS